MAASSVFVFLGLLALGAATIHFKETFDDSWSSRWVVSDFKKSSGEQGKWIHSAGAFYGDAEEDKGLSTTEDARFYAISASFPAFSNKGKDLVIQFSVKHPQKLDCGGGYVKVFPSSLDQVKMTDKSDYNVMFGPDICGHTKKVHVIFSHKGTNHLINKEISCETDQLTHVYTLIVRPDNTYEVRIDGKKKESGSLEKDWDILPSQMIKDPKESKPSDWVDDAMMDDPNDKKPEGYDQIPSTIADPDAEQPDTWDEEEDGPWEAPTIPNPEYKGPWKAKRISNPDYKGKWVHPEIPNPDFVANPDLYSYEDFGAIGLDLWQVKSGSVFDNIIITDSVDEAESFMKETYSKNKEAEKKAFDEHEAKERAAESAAPTPDDGDDDGDDDDDDKDEL
jgi:calreticulin